MVDLDAIDDALLQHVYSSKTEEQKEVIGPNWKKIRDIIAQNAGLGRWGSHLRERDIVQLRQEADATITNVESRDISNIFTKNTKNLPGINYFFFNRIEKDHITLKNAEAIFLKYDKNFASEHCQYLQQQFKHLVTHESWKARDPVIAEMLIMNLVGLLPFFGLESLAEIELPRLIDKTWQLVTYKIELISLTDTIHAYGLVAQGSSNALPILIFRGTPYPAMPGFLDAVLSDVHPSKDVGQDLFEKGKGNLDNWMKGKPKVDCCGISLGGALAHHAAGAYGEQIYLNGAVASPGMTSQNGGQVYGRSFYNYYDFVKYIGYFPESKNLELYFVLSKEESSNPYSAHVRPMGIEPTILVKINPKYENKTWARFFANIFKKVGSPFASLFLIPLKYFLILVTKIKSLWND